MTLRCLGARRICRCTAAAFALQALLAARGTCALRVQGQSGRGTGGLAWSGRAASRRAHRRKRRALCPLRTVWIQADARAQIGASALHRHQVSASECPSERLSGCLSECHPECLSECSTRALHLVISLDNGKTREDLDLRESTWSYQYYAAKFQLLHQYGGSLENLLNASGCLGCL